jgi:hypothetical protein
VFKEDDELNGIVDWPGIFRTIIFSIVVREPSVFKTAIPRWLRKWVGSEIQTRRTLQAARGSRIVSAIKPLRESVAGSPIDSY